MRKIFLLLFLLGLSSSSWASGPIDSLKQLYYSGTLEVDSQQIQLYQQLGDSLRLSEPDTALFFFKKGVAFSTKIKDTLALTAFLAEIGNIHQRLGRDIEALEYLRRSYLLSKEHGKMDERSLAYLLINIGNIYFSEEVYSVARSYYQKAEEGFVAIRDTNGILLCWKNVGLVFDRQDICDSAIFYYQKALDVELELPDRAHEKAIAYNYLGLAYGCYRDRGEDRIVLMRKAENYFQKSGGEQKDPKLRISFYYNFASAFRMAGQIDSAEHYLGLFEEGLERWPEYKDLFEVSRIYMLKSIARAKGDYDKALELTWKIIEDSLLPPKRLYPQYQVLSVLYEEKGDLESALKYHKMYTKDLDQRKKDKFAGKVVEMYAAMENFEQRRALDLKEVALQKEQALKEQETEARQLYALALIGVLSLLIVLAFLYRQVKRSKEQLEAQNEIIEASSRKLQRLNQTKDKLMSILAHDLRGPFGNMLQLSTQLSQQLSQQPIASRSQELAEGLSKTAKSSYLLFEDLLSWSKNQAGALQVHQKPLVLSAIAKEVLDLFQSQLYEKSIRVKQDWTAQGLKTDEDMLRTILRNLMANALRHSPRGGILTLRSRAEGQTVIVEIEDEAGGIPPAILKNLFSEERWKQRQGNSGLGLVLCQQFMHKQGGQIEVHSKLGQGTRFELIFPKALTSVNAPAPSDSSAAGLQVPDVAMLSKQLGLWQRLVQLKHSQATELMRICRALLQNDSKPKSYLALWRDALLQQDLALLQQLQAELRQALQQLQVSSSE